jgi:hypothetical protein
VESDMASDDQIRQEAFGIIGLNMTRRQALLRFSNRSRMVVRSRSSLNDDRKSKVRCEKSRLLN